MFANRYFAPRYFAPRYFPPVSDLVVVEPVLDLKSYTHDRFRELIMQEDEELLIIARAFIEILRCR